MNCACAGTVFFLRDKLHCSKNPSAKNSFVINLQTQSELSAWFQRRDEAAAEHLKTLAEKSSTTNPSGVGEHLWYIANTGNTNYTSVKVRKH